MADFPTPKYITGGCLCGALRYEVTFPPDHDFKSSTSTLYLVSHRVRPASNYRFTSDTSTLKNFQASPLAERGFCTGCGSLMYWRYQDRTGDRDYVCMTVGTVDPLFLFGEGADGITTGGGINDKPVPKNGYGLALASGEGNHWWCGNEIPGVTDNVPIAGHGRGTKWPGDE
ncbi:hypothetical protein OQA88_7849 [Cercophora sp. LCS_1]